MRRITLSPAAPHENSNDSCPDNNSIVEAALANLENDIDDTDDSTTSKLSTSMTPLSSSLHDDPDVSGRVQRTDASGTVLHLDSILAS
ncbi:hypothetical protein AX14_009939 [Amanita brunnescens Koide BX004]|nr:hypothetical protein AX14_009939 [Amanita brunnescens Koide BX004]